VPDSTDATALVVFGRRQVCEPLSVEFYAREHRLTAAETSVLRGLADGLRPAQIAREAGVAMSTVRTQITSIRLKTGARSIGELVRLVTVLPPIVPVLN
jgi:DNA-binding CsgD family transcriptional regulator